MVKIQIVSDIHLEFRGENFQKLIKPSAPILFLLGDICVCGTDSDFEVYKKFIKFLAPQYKYIFHVPGNHEYYTAGSKNITKDTIQSIDIKIRKYTKQFNNVYFMNNDTIRFEIDGRSYVFVGTALWTMVSPENRKMIGSRMNDYSHIYFLDKLQIRKFTVNDMSAIHEKSVRYVKKIMKTIKSGEIALLLTHHKPILDNSKDEFHQAYESDLANIIIKHPFKLAAHGHTHVRYDKVINNVRVVSNPKGYVSQKTRFDDSFVVDI